MIIGKEGKVFLGQEVSTEAQLQSTTGGTPFGTYDLLVLNAERKEITSSEAITTLDIS